MSLNFSEKQINEFKTAFSKFDKDGNSSISLDELGKVMKYLEIDVNDSELNNMVKKKHYYF